MAKHDHVRFILLSKWYAVQNPDSDVWEVRTRESVPGWPFGVLVIHTEFREIAEHLVYLQNKNVGKERIQNVS